MIFYQRKIYAKLILIRCISFAAGIVCYFSFNDGYTNLGYFLAVALVFLSIISIEDLIIYPDHFEVKRIYLFGILPVKWTFSKKENVVLHSYAPEFGAPDEGEGFAHVETPAGALFYIYGIFGVKSRVTHRKFAIKKKNPQSGSDMSIELFLSKEEFELLKDLTMPKAHPDFNYDSMQEKI